MKEEVKGNREVLTYRRKSGSVWIANIRGKTLKGNEQDYKDTVWLLSRSNAFSKLLPINYSFTYYINFYNFILIKRKIKNC